MTAKALVKVARTGEFGLRWHVEVVEPTQYGADIEYWGREASTVTFSQRGAKRWALRQVRRWAASDRAAAAAQTFELEVPSS